MLKGYRLTASTGIHKGDREYQQDQVALLNHPRINGCILAIVADGMGGRSGGRKASDQVMMTTRQLFERYSPETDDAAAMLMQLVKEAHIVIKLTAVSSEEEPHSTVAAFLINPGGDCHWIHAGDSRVYHYHGAKYVKRTMDHSYVQTLVNRGEITEEEAEKILGFKPEISMTEGLKQLKAWYETQSRSPQELLAEEIVYNWEKAGK